MFANQYIERFTDKRELITEAPSFDLGLIVVVPAFNEPQLICSLQSLYDCLPIGKSLEVIIVINYSSAFREQWQTYHLEQYINVHRWCAAHSTDSKRFYTLLEELPAKHAGVGLARKTGMDEAVRRFNMLNNQKGIIICYDADCTCDANYLSEIERLYEHRKMINACAVYFEHPVAGSEYEPEVYQSIVLYELYLRYYNTGLRYCGLPYAFHSVGSSFTVSADAYCKQGGMNKRKAGEDFYFLLKIKALGNFVNLTTTTVRPSPRKSDRVPFGTGAAINKMIDSSDKKYLTFSPLAFIEIKCLVDSLELAFGCKDNSFELFIDVLPLNLKTFLIDHQLISKLAEIKRYSTNLDTFVKRFYTWFDGLMVLQFFNATYDAIYKSVPVCDAAREMLKMFENREIDGDALLLLQVYRDIDRNDKR